MASEEQQRDFVRRRLLGWSVACGETFPGFDVGRDLVLAGGNGRPLDLARAEGMDCLSQSLTLALTTALGSDVFNVEFGFDGLNAMLDDSEPILVRERVRIAVIRVLQKDPRVRRILEVNLGAEVTGATTLSGDATGSRVLPVRVEFETVASERATVNLGKVVPGV